MLVTALVGPYLIDWNAFRPTLERRAAAILGQPVRIIGEADLKLLPVPTVTFETVEVGDTEGVPMATIERFSIKLELLPLLRGQFNVTEMTLDRPRINLTVDDTGTVDWMMRPEGLGTTLDPARVSFDSIVVNDGGLRFYDARTGGVLELAQINTNLFEAGSLSGPWRIEGSLICRTGLVCRDSLPVTFSLSGSRPAEDGSTRVSAAITPASAEFAGTLITNGVLRRDDKLLVYDGIFRFDKLAIAAETGQPSPAEQLTTAWTISGGFELDAEKLALDEFTWESSDGMFALTGTAKLSLGEGAAYSATLVSRQIDLDRAFGEGASNATTVADAGSEIWRRVLQIGRPDLPGRITLTIPSVIVSGSVLQDVAAEIVATDDHWQLETLRLQLPGQTELSVSGRLVPGEAPSFVGTVDLSSEQPPIFVGWLRGRDQSAINLSAFAAEAEIEIGADRVAAENAVLRIGQSTLTGALSWTDGAADDPRPLLEANLATRSFDFEQLRSLTELLLQPAFSEIEPGEAAARYAIRFVADELLVGEVVITDVELDAELTPDIVTITSLVIGDLDGARIELAGSWIERQSTTPRGTLTASIEAERLGGVLALARQMAADAEVTQWLEKAAPFLVPLDLEAVLAAPAATGFAYRASVAGIAAGTSVRVEIDTEGGPDGWATDQARLLIDIDAADGAELARQVGLAVTDLVNTGLATFDLTATGVPADGMATHLQVVIAGVLVASDGTLTVDGRSDERFAGPVRISGDLDPLLRLAGLSLPNAGEPMPAVLNAQLDIVGREIGIDLRPSSVAERAIAGELQLVEAGGVWRLSGALRAEEVDLGWVATLPLGVIPLPGGDVAEPWSRMPFTGSLLGQFELDLSVAADHFVVSENLIISNADISIALSAKAARLELLSGSLATGRVRAGAFLEFEDGQAIMNGQLVLDDVPLETLVWRSGGQPVAVGLLTLTAEFGATGRSPAGLVSTLTGRGTLDIGHGVFHFLGADAFDLIIRLADEGGEAMTKPQLREMFIGFLDAGYLSFGSVAVPFDILGGIVTPSPIIVEGDGVRSVARAPIDLNRLTIDSSWELTLFAGRLIDDGPRPRAFVTFTGPLAEPVRQVNVTPLAGYLSLRRLRETDLLQAEVLERERFIRMIERIEADRAAAVRELVPAAEDAPIAPEPPLLIPGGP